MIGKPVTHHYYGRGIIRGSRQGGFEVRVQFNSEFVRWVRLDELDEFKSPKENKVSSEKKEIQKKKTLKSPVLLAPTTPSPPVKVRIKTPKTDAPFMSRQIIEALRIGVVPYDRVDEFTFGREKEIEAIRGWLEDAETNTKIVVGEYGSGKTHLLKYMHSRALLDGFAASYVALDPTDSPLWKPKRVFETLIQNMKYIDDSSMERCGFRNLLLSAFDRGILKDHKYFRYVDRNRGDDKIWNWIECREAAIRPYDMYDRYSSLPGLYDYTTAANVYCYLLSALAFAAKEAAGLKGLVLIFDEAESIDNTYYHYQIERGKNFLKSLIKTARSDDRLLGRPAMSGLDYCSVGLAGTVPFLYKKDCGLKALFAFTNLEWNYDSYWDRVNEHPIIEEIDEAPSVHLDALEDKHLKQVFGGICSHYERSYNFKCDKQISESVFTRINNQSGRTRQFMKGSVEALDIVRHRGVIPTN